jgi:hypothetical protein
MSNPARIKFFDIIKLNLQNIIYLFNIRLIDE